MCLNGVLESEAIKSINVIVFFFLLIFEPSSNFFLIFPSFASLPVALGFFLCHSILMIFLPVVLVIAPLNSGTRILGVY